MPRKKQQEIDPSQDIFDEAVGNIRDIANERFENDEYDQADKLESINSLIDDIKYGYIPKD